MLGVSASTVDRHVRKAVRSVRIGGCVRFDVEDLRAWADRQKGGDSPGKAPAECARLYAHVIEHGAPRRSAVALSLQPLDVLFADWLAWTEGILDVTTSTNLNPAACTESSLKQACWLLELRLASAPIRTLRDRTRALHGLRIASRAWLLRSAA